MEISSVQLQHQHQHQHQHQAMNSSNQLMNMEEIMLTTGAGSKSAEQNQERKPRPQPEQALKCPRCESTNTKFCYYNNYSLSQPRYFCKGCRRYWTQGGSLRNVPVGGGCRKNNKRPSSSSSKKPQDHQQTLITTNPLPLLPPLSYAPTVADSLSLAPFLSPNPNPSPNFLDILRSGFLEPANPAGFSNHGSSYGFDGGLGLSCPATTMAAAADGDQESRMVMGHQWQFSDGGNNSDNVGVDDHHSARDYYNWHGIINSSLM